MTQLQVHIGKLIKQKFDEKNMSKTDFAQKIHCHRTNVNYIFERKSIDIKQLMLISDVLEYDFASDIFPTLQQKNAQKTTP